MQLISEAIVPDSGNGAKLMVSVEQKIAEYLDEAYATEQALARSLEGQVAVAQRGRHRAGLESHLKQTKEHAKRVRQRLRELDYGPGLFGLGAGLLQTVIGQALAFCQVPWELARGSSGDEKVLKNAKDACASEALEIATYTAIEHLADALGDTRTANLASSIRAEEQKMLDRLLAEIPELTDAVIAAEVRGHSGYQISETGAADKARTAARRTGKAARDTRTKVRQTSRQARKVPGVARAEGLAKGAVASEGDLPISNYGKRTASEIVDRLGDLSQIDLAKVDSYERRHENRTTILAKVTSLRHQEPWPGYDELDVAEVRSVLGEADETRARRVASYERSHKKRAGVLDAVEHELSNA
jgi:ferritin-like metal-binding protein YciE